MRRWATVTLNVLCLALGTGCDSNSTPGTDTGGASTTSASTTSDGGTDPCPHGTPYCLCFEGMCFEGLTCNADDRCVPAAGPPIEGGGDTGTGGAEGGSETGVQAECTQHDDCPVGYLCDLAECEWGFDRRYSISIVDRLIECDDGAGACELLFYWSMWDWKSESWESVDRRDFVPVGRSATLLLSVWESDLFQDDYITSFTIGVAQAVESMKDGVPLRIHDGELQDGRNWAEFELEALE